MSPGPARRTAISLFALGLFGGAAAAQTPPAPPPAQAAATTPAATQWTPYPKTVVQAKPLPRLTPLAPPPGSPVVASTPGVPTKPMSDQEPALPAIPSVTLPAVPVGRAADPLPFIGAATPDSAPQQKPQDTPALGEKKPVVEPPAKPGPDTPAPALPATPGAMPNKTEVFRFDNDSALNGRILRDLGKSPTESVRVPPAKLVPDNVTYQPKTLSYPPTVALREPNYVVHRRLYFEERNAERYGWDAGPIQPFVSMAYFYRDTILWPQNLMSGMFRERYETSAGKCLPGDPVPYKLYPLGLTTSGLITEAVVVTGLVFLFP